jgi:hypothetical protein
MTTSPRSIANRSDLPGPPNNPPTYDVPAIPLPAPGNPDWMSPDNRFIDDDVDPADSDVSET